MVAIRPRTRKDRRYRAAAAAARDRLDHVRADIRDLGRVGHPVLAREREVVIAALTENRRELAKTTAHGSIPALAPMDLDRWVLWRPDGDASVDEVRVGSLREGPDGEALPVPCVVPFASGRALVIVSRTDRQREDARALWRSVVARISALASGNTEVVLLDPMGTAFQGAERLFSRTIGASDIPGELTRWVAEDTSPPSRVIAACDVPAGLSQRDAALLLAWIRSGAPNGSTLVLHVAEDEYRSAIGEADLGDAAHRWLIDLGDTHIPSAGSASSVVWDAAPPRLLVELIAERLAAR